MWKYYIIGVVGIITYGLFLIFACAVDYHSGCFITSDITLLKFLLIFLPGGLVAGYIGGWLEKNIFGKSCLGTIGTIFGTLALSIFLSVVLSAILAFFE